MKIKKILYIVLSLGIIIYFLPFKLFSDDLGKANKYYERYDYKYAIEIYERLLSDKPTLEVAQKLANSYRFINNTVEAEKAYATVLTFPGFDPINYIYYAEVLKQNGKFDQAKRNYLIYAERVPAKADESVKLANGCDAARLWLDNPDLNVKLVNESGMNTEYSDFSPIPYDKGFIFVSDREFLRPIKNKDNKSKKIYGWTGNPYLKLYQAENQNDTLDGNLKLTVMPEQINDLYHSGPATLTSDGRVMYFTKAGIVNDPNINERKIKGLVMKKAIYYSVKQGGVWTQAVSFPYNKPYDYSLEHPALSPDGKTLYFASDMPGTLGGMDLFYSENTGSGWSKPKNCGPEINTAQDEVFPYVRKDGKLFFSSRGHITIGGLDIFSSTGDKSNWTEPENLKAPFNSPKDDFGIYYFDDNLTGFISSNRFGGKGSDDIYQFDTKPKPVFFAVQGEVVEKGTGNPIAGVKIFLVDKKTGKETSLFSDEEGSFKFDLNKETDYVVRGDLDKYFSRQQGEITTKGAKESTVYNVKFEVEKGEDAYLVRLNNIYYDFNKANIRKDAEPELNKVLSFMSTTPNVNVELRSHTDSRGNAAYNMDLSQRRAKSAEQYLLKNGANKEKLTAQGFGETQLLNKCSDGVKCSKEEHQLNRRTEFKVVKVTPTISYVPAFKLESMFPSISGTK
ncbi:OmpA family protein [Pedobacter psychrophilus]|uniref:OmpA family protein n=1 Tax=Pedobacter psychrophilus TaxID=1826909 RepID=UPI00083B1C23|nr:OmpA family protein [Pedobacter psychrophilus]